MKAKICQKHNNESINYNNNITLKQEIIFFVN